MCSGMEKPCEAEGARFDSYLVPFLFSFLIFFVVVWFSLLICFVGFFNTYIFFFLFFPFLSTSGP